MEHKTKNLQAILDRVVDQKKVFGTSFCLKYNHQKWCGASGNLTTGSQYFIASTTKLFVTSVILHLRWKGKLQLDNPIADYLGNDIINGLHILNGKEYSKEITIRNLLAHTSGIPDYFQLKKNNGRSLQSEITAGNDQAWSFEEAIEYSKSLRPRFAPNRKGKAHYSDTNFQLLGKIIENITRQSLSDNFEALLFKPLSLSKTYLYQDIKDTRPIHFYFRSNPMPIPQAMKSFGADGGIVSDSGELMVFLEHFFNGAFFPTAYLPELTTWNRIFFPLQAGVGIHRLKLPWFFDPTGAIPELIGHSGLSGTIAYCSPQNDLFITGTVNQVAFPDTSFRLAIKLIRKVLSK